MKILIVQTYHYYRGGDCTYGFALANLLISRGHQVNFFGMKHPANLYCKDEKYFVDYIDFREANQNKNILSAIKVISRSIYSSHVKKKFKLILEEINPDIIHIQNLHGHITPSILFAAKKQKIPIVMTLHDYKFICPNTHLLSNGQICQKCIGGNFFQCTINKCKKKSLLASLIASTEAYVHNFLKIKNLVDIYISPSVFLKNKFIEFGWPENKIEVVNNFLRDGFFENKSNSNENYVLYFGQLEAWKGLETLVLSAKILPHIKFIVAGEGSIRENLLQTCSLDGIKNIEFLGYQTGQVLHDVIKNAKVVLMPSEWYENYPYSIMEAMAFGKPIIASDIGGLPELVRHGKNGLLFKKGDHVELAELLDNIFNDEEKLRKYGNASFDFAKNYLTEEYFLKKIMIIYNKLRTKEY